MTPTDANRYKHFTKKNSMDFSVVPKSKFYAFTTHPNAPPVFRKKILLLNSKTQMVVIVQV